MKKYNLDDLDSTSIKKIGMHKNKFETIFDLMHVEVFKPDENIVHFNHDVDKLRFLISGKAKITMVHEDGKRSIIHFVEPNEFIGELTLLSIEKQPKDVIAINECIFLSISISKAKEVLLTDVDFLLMMNRYIGTKLLNRTWFSTKSQNYELKNRLAAYILMAECNGIYKEKHIETAEYLGISYRHLLHTLKSFQLEGLLIKDGKSYKIEQEKLRDLAKDIKQFHTESV